ncbi:hypothetical protein CFII64_23479 [Pseudomonas sp. CFII64]|nr:hypothetical protein CFII64_23479 [Pseudomonas sp. CFII64]
MQADPLKVEPGLSRQGDDLGVVDAGQNRRQTEWVLPDEPLSV